MIQRPIEPYAADARRLLAPLPTKEPACCCSARPTLRALVPVSLGRTEVVELLLCGHRYWSGVDSLHRIGAFAFDAAGALRMPRSSSPDAHATTVV
jgi:hypothetical protein